MLTRSFIHLQGVGNTTEARLWERGATDWDAFLANKDALGMARGKLDYWADCLEECRERLAVGDSRFFARSLAPRDQWRAFPEFKDCALYLDIETTGTGVADTVTVIGVYDGREMRQYVRGVNMHLFPVEMERCGLLVTFFGSGFDLPVLRHAFPQVRFDVLHIDLCYALKRLGYSGGLKHVETALGVGRDASVAGLNGWDAVRLWHEYRQGNGRSLARLLAYNEADVVNMERLMDIAYTGLCTKVLGASAAGPSERLNARTPERPIP
jgi:uncharacterized protein YprB with RNaseH-like and TPR domain